MGVGSGQAELTVEDNGQGFSPSARGRAFERFVKGQHSTGHGLGLVFVDVAIRAHGGHVEIADGERSGALIVFASPLVEVLSEKV